ncbi:rRNA pseudouridine synthase [Candidatus Woesearchaeota archaeon]|nr:rRNA pseudouridine synthase [Candidatus Woesearchaeota archaeon]
MYKKRTIYQILVEAGLVKSKKEALDIVRSERIKVEDKIVTSLHFQLNPRKKKITLDDKEINLEDRRKYFVINKPEGVITTKENMLEFLKDFVGKEELYSFYPVGRLDKETTGLLILTNDGRFGDKVLNPKQKIPKTYEVTIKGQVHPEALEDLEFGVVIELEENGIVTDYQTLPADVKVLSSDKVITKIEIKIMEGKKRQVRRMVEALGYEVLNLKRTKIGKLELGNLKPCEIKEIPRYEIYKKLFE